jgi:hypothetical protein
VAEPVGAQAGDACVGADGQDDVDDPGDRQRAALPEPQRAGLAAALVQPGRERVAGNLGQWDGADLVALAVEADGAGAGGDREVVDRQPRALLLTGAVWGSRTRPPALIWASMRRVRIR